MKGRVIQVKNRGLRNPSNGKNLEILLVEPKFGHKAQKRPLFYVLNFVEKNCENRNFHIFLTRFLKNH